MNQSPEQILALAPDAASAKSGRDLAVARKWVVLQYAKGTEEQPEVIWGECQGSGKVPYRTVVNAGEPAFKCTCPSRKFPCKHALGLFLLRASQAAAFSTSEPPDWVSEWLAARSARQQKTERAEQSSAVIVVTAAQNELGKAAAAAKRSAAREKKIAAGLAELELWLQDLVRQGLASVQGKPVSFWDATGARLVDAQAPGAARLVRALGDLPASGDRWADAMLKRLSLLHLLAKGYKRQDELPPDQRADVRSLIGWTVEQDEVRAQSGVNDKWFVLGRSFAEEERLRVERTWLWSTQSDRAALVMSFVPIGQAHGALNSQTETMLVAGTCVEAELAFFPGAYPLRAVVKERRSAEAFMQKDFVQVELGYASVDKATEAYAGALARSPWLEIFPMLLREVTPQLMDESWIVRDAASCFLPLAEKFSGKWQLLAASGGNPVRLFGEWNGTELLPLGVWYEEESYFWT